MKTFQIELTHDYCGRAIHSSHFLSGSKASHSIVQKLLVVYHLRNGDNNTNKGKIITQTISILFVTLS